MFKGFVFQIKSINPISSKLWAAILKTPRSILH